MRQRLLKHSRRFAPVMITFQTVGLTLYVSLTVCYVHLCALNQWATILRTKTLLTHQFSLILVVFIKMTNFVIAIRSIPNKLHIQWASDHR
ncbi:hypothetical protein RB195_021718 [Necator americanus]|uniref:Serpentine receptor class gamma n=1 Tax=Necator americanus TaxID=51031 RepID=A0ABR1ECD9_NECAM